MNSSEVISANIHVNIGEVKMGSNNDILKATLGSCVGIAFLWESENKFGLAHCLLPSTEAEFFKISAKHVNHGILSLIKIMNIAENHYKEIDVYIAGGANMLNQLTKSNPNHIGLQNAKAAIDYLGNLGFRIRVKDTGGDEARQIIVNCKKNEVEFKKIVKQIQVNE